MHWWDGHEGDTFTISCLNAINIVRCFFSYSIIYDWNALRRRTGSMSLRPMKCDILFISHLPLKGRKSQEVHATISAWVSLFRCRSKGSIKGSTFGASNRKAPKQKWKISFLGIRFSSVRFFFVARFAAQCKARSYSRSFFDLCRDLRRYSNESQFNGEMEMAWMNAKNVSSFSIGFVFAGASNKRNAPKPQWQKEEEKNTRENF